VAAATGPEPGGPLSDSEDEATPRRWRGSEGGDAHEGGSSWGWYDDTQDVYDLTGEAPTWAPAPPAAARADGGGCKPAAAAAGVGESEGEGAGAKGRRKHASAAAAKGEAGSGGARGGGTRCALCERAIERYVMGCGGCGARFHIQCLGERFAEEQQAAATAGGSLPPPGSSGGGGGLGVAGEALAGVPLWGLGGGSSGQPGGGAPWLAGGACPGCGGALDWLDLVTRLLPYGTTAGKEDPRPGGAMRGRRWVGAWEGRCVSSTGAGAEPGSAPCMRLTRASLFCPAPGPRQQEQGPQGAAAGGGRRQPRRWGRQQRRPRRRQRQRWRGRGSAARQARAGPEKSCRCGRWQRGGQCLGHSCAGSGAWHAAAPQARRGRWP
jgi:hypothetical protein